MYFNLFSSIPVVVFERLFRKFSQFFFHVVAIGLLFLIVCDSSSFISVPSARLLTMIGFVLFVVCFFFSFLSSYCAAIGGVFVYYFLAPQSMLVSLQRFSLLSVCRKHCNFLSDVDILSAVSLLYVSALNTSNYICSLIPSILRVPMSLSFSLTSVTNSRMNLFVEEGSSRACFDKRF